MGKVPGLILMSLACYDNFESTLFTQEHYILAPGAGEKAFGYGSVSWQGIPVAAETYMLNSLGVTPATGDNITSAYVLNFNFLKIHYPKNSWFRMSPAIQGTPGDFNGIVGVVDNQCALNASHIASQGFLSDGDTV
jgi:hypothetical protein